MLGLLERIGTEIKNQWNAQFHLRLRPDHEALGTLFKKADLPLFISHGHKIAIVAPVHELLARPFLGFALERGHEVIAVEMNLKGFVSGLLSFEAFLNDVWISRRCQKCWQHILVSADLIVDSSRLDDSGRANDGRNAPASFPVR